MQTGWQNQKIYADADSFFSDLMDGVAKATHSVDLETYIFARDGFGERMEQGLTAAAKRGVKVRLLVDGVGSSVWLEQSPDTLLAAGVEVRVYHLVIWSHLRGLLFKAVRNLTRLLRYFSYLNRRNHRKTCVIDGRIAFIGSCNVMAASLREFAGEQAWRETGVQVSGPPIPFLENAFAVAWRKGHTLRGRREHWWRSLNLPSPASNWIRLNYTWPLRLRSQRDFMDHLRAATRRIWITNPYFAPAPDVYAALLRACRKGLDVRILVPERSDIFFMQWVNESYFQGLNRAGARIFMYQPRFLHAKTLLFDDWAQIGTSNFNTRSFWRDLEVDVCVEGAAAVRELEQHFEHDCGAAKSWHKRIILAWLGRQVAWAFKNLL